MKSDRKLLALLAMSTVLAVVGVAVVITLLATGDGDTSSTPPAPTTTITVTEPVIVSDPDPEPAGDLTGSISGDGTYEVGVDMRPGTYRSVDNFGCYWQVSRDPNGSDILSNDNTDGAAIVTVRRGQFFTSQGCDDWSRR